MKKKFIPQSPAILEFSKLTESFNTLRRADVSNGTITRSRIAAKHLIDYAGGQLPCSVVDKPLLAGFVGYLQKEKNLSTNTIRAYMSSLSPIVKYGVSRGYIPNNFNFPKP